MLEIKYNYEDTNGKELFDKLSQACGLGEFTGILASELIHLYTTTTDDQVKVDVLTELRKVCEISY